MSLFEQRVLTARYLGNGSEGGFSNIDTRHHGDVGLGMGVGDGIRVGYLLA